MSDRPESPVQALRTMWAAEGAPASIEEDCSPQKTCKNMRQVSFDGFAGPGTDLRTAWRQKLAREGKLSEAPGQTIRDLVLGANAAADAAGTGAVAADVSR